MTLAIDLKAQRLQALAEIMYEFYLAKTDLRMHKGRLCNPGLDYDQQETYNACQKGRLVEHMNIYFGQYLRPSEMEREGFPALVAAFARHPETHIVEVNVEVEPA